MDFDFLLTPEGANYLRELADYLPIAVDNVNNATISLMNVYNIYEDDIGPHRQYFIDMLKNVQSANRLFAESIGETKIQLCNMADKIDDFCKNINPENPDDGHTPPVRVRVRR